MEGGWFPGLVLGGAAGLKIFPTAGNWGHGSAEADEVWFGSRRGFRRTSVGTDPRAGRDRLRSALARSATGKAFLARAQEQQRRGERPAHHSVSTHREATTLRQLSQRLPTGPTDHEQAGRPRDRFVSTLHSLFSVGGCIYLYTAALQKDTPSHLRAHASLPPIYIYTPPPSKRTPLRT